MNGGGRKIANPASPTGEPIEISTRTDEPISDRGYRYRAVQVFSQLPAKVRNVCHFCGRTSMSTRIDAAHVDGHEENSDPSNISGTCKTCNSVMGATFARHDIGRRTIQYNPALPARDADSYARAVQRLLYGESSTAIRRAIATIQATSHHDRAAFARAMRSRA